jgi:hypothetical protein
MSRRSIITALADKFKLINGSAPYQINIFNNSYPYLKFWDEVVDFPSVYLSAGSEIRDYLPGNFKWGYLNISVKLYCKGDDSQEQLEQLLEDVEFCIDSNRVMVYDNTTGAETTEIQITSITTDEGLLSPYAIGEINLQVRYQVM